MSRYLAVVALSLSLPTVASADPQAFSGAQHRPCRQLFTPSMGRRAAKAVYRGTRHASMRNLRLLGYIERCQIRPRDQPRVRTYDRHMDAMNKARRNPPPAPAPVSSGGWTSPWDCIAKYESGGDPHADTGNGFYGGLQFTMETWHAYGGVGNPADASIQEQEAVAERVLHSQGWGAWPNTSRMCGL